MILALIGAVIPHLLSLFGKKQDDETAVEVQGFKTLKSVLRYKGIRILVIVVVSVIVSLWTVEQVHDIIVQWHGRAPDALRFFGAAGVSGILRAVFTRL